MCLLGALALSAAIPASSLPAVFRPHLKSGDVLVYQTDDKVTGSVDHDMQFVHTYVIESVDGKEITFQNTVKATDSKNGNPAPRVQTIDDNGLVADAGGKPTKPSRLFMLNENQFGVPPSALALGTTWKVNLDESDFGFAPGVATVRVAALDGDKVDLHIDYSGDGTRVMPGLPGQPSMEIHFKTEAHADVKFQDGILVSWHSASKENQDVAGGSDGAFFKTSDYKLVGNAL
jgi:hypothetical protein